MWAMRRDRDEAQFDYVISGYGGTTSYDINNVVKLVISDRNVGYATSLSEWTHYALTYDHDGGSGGDARGQIYVDGVAQSFGLANFVNPFNFTTERLVSIGAQSSPLGYRPIGGAIDSVKIYDEVLSASQVADAANAALIPEPATLGLLGLAGAAFLMRRRRG